MFDLVKKSMMLGFGALSLTKEKTESIIDELVRKGEINSEEARVLVQDFLEKGKREKEMLSGIINQEVQKRLGEMGIATKREVLDLEARIAKLENIEDGKLQ